MKDEVDDLAEKLRGVFGNGVEIRFIDVMSDEIIEYPDVMQILKRVSLPLTVIGGKPRFHGGLAMDMIIDAVHEQKTGRQQA